MALYKIIRVYEVPGENAYQATDRMREALFLRVEKHFHVRDIVREPDAKSGEGTDVDLGPATSWLELALTQLGIRRR